MANKVGMTRGDSATANQGPTKIDDISVINIATPGRADTRDPFLDPENKIGGDIKAQLKLLNTSEEYLDYVEYPSIPDTKTAYQIFRLAPYLAPILEAISANVYGAGFTFDPVIDLDTTAGVDEVRRALELEMNNDNFDGELEPSDEEVNKAVEKYRTRARRELTYLNNWFDNAVQCPENTYRSICILVGQDKGVIGTGYWEILRDTQNKPRRLIWTPAWSIRCRATRDVVAVRTTVNKTKLSQEEVIHWKKFRSYVQLNTDGMIITRFKEFGDPRILSRETGKYYDSLEEFQATEGRPQKDNTIYTPPQATELVDFRDYYAGSMYYGRARWTNHAPDLMGLRELSEENREIITDSAIPNMMIFIAGPRVDAGMEKRIEDKLRNRKPGNKSIIVVNAHNQANAAAGSTGTPLIHVEKTRDVQHTDGLGMNYRDAIYEDILRAYRYPRACLGDDKDLDRGTAYAMFRFADDQVHDPIRDDFDDRINNTILKDLGIMCWRYRTQTRTPKDPELVGKLLDTLSRAGVLTPNESRSIAENIFNRKFNDIQGSWAQLPLGILIALLQTKNQVTAAAVLNQEQDPGEFLEHLRDAIWQQFESAGVPSGLRDKQSNQQSNQDDSEDEDTKEQTDESNGQEEGGGRTED